MKIEVSRQAGSMILDVIESMEGHLYDRGPVPHSALGYWAASLREILIEAERQKEEDSNASGAW